MIRAAVFLCIKTEIHGRQPAARKDSSLPLRMTKAPFEGSWICRKAKTEGCEKFHTILRHGFAAPPPFQRRYLYCHPERRRGDYRSSGKVICIINNVILNEVKDLKNLNIRFFAVAQNDNSKGDHRSSESNMPPEKDSSLPPQNDKSSF